MYEIEIMFRLITQSIQGNTVKIKDVTEESFSVFIGAISLCCGVHSNVAQSKHNNIFNNVKFSTCFGNSSHHQADISVHGYDMLIVTVWDPYCLHLL